MPNQTNIAENQESQPVNLSDYTPLEKLNFFLGEIRKNSSSVKDDNATYKTYIDNAIEQRIEYDDESNAELFFENVLWLLRSVSHFPTNEVLSDSMLCEWIDNLIGLQAENLDKATEFLCEVVNSALDAVDGQSDTDKPDLVRDRLICNTVAIYLQTLMMME